MARWFENKFERENLRRYSKKRLNNNYTNFLRKLSVTNWLIIINTLIFFIIFVLSKIFGEAFSNQIYSILAIQANSFFSGFIWTPFTSMFMHASWIHLFVNMLSLFFLGNFIEKIIGRKRIFWLYIASGIFAGLFFAFLSYFIGSICIVEIFGGCLGSKIFSSPTTFAVGASGAIFALAGLLAILTPKNKVYLIAGPLIAIIAQEILSPFLPEFSSALGTIVTVYILFSLFAMFSFNNKIKKIALPLEMPFWLLPVIAIVPLVIIGLFIDLPIGNMAHLGGLIAGMYYGLYLKRKYQKKTEMISRIFSK